jgi:hypothetical protein
MKTNFINVKNVMINVLLVTPLKDVFYAKGIIFFFLYYYIYIKLISTIN